MWLTDRLPGLKMKLHEKLRTVRQELATLPKSYADNPQANLLSLCSAFIQDVDNYTSGKPNDDPEQATFLRDVLSSYRDLKQKILSTRLQFQMEPRCTTPITPEASESSLPASEVPEGIPPPSIL